MLSLFLPIYQHLLYLKGRDVPNVTGNKRMCNRTEAKEPIKNMPGSQMLCK